MEEKLNHRKDTKKTNLLGRSGAALVATGILLSRMMGLVRQKIFAFYFGNSDLGDAFYAALKIPNFSQNLLGDGVLSASFIPVYSQLLARGEQEEADRVAGVIGTLLAMLIIVIVSAGVLGAPYLIDLIAPGFEGEKRALTLRLVQIFFPGTGFLVMSAWCLGVLNSHRKFFLSYAAPVVWNLAIIFTLLVFGDKSAPEILVEQTAWGVFVGSLLQFLIQLPTVFKCAPNLKFKPVFQNEHIQTVFRSFLPVVTSRGVIQISSYIDNILASLLPTGAVSALAYAQSLYMLPISLFGMSVSAAELPAMSGATGTREEIAEYLKKRLASAFRQISFFVIPSVVGFVLLGDVMIDGLYRGGEFTRADTLRVWIVLGGATVGLLASTIGRLYSSTFYSLKDTKTPLRFAVIRVVIGTGMGFFFSLHAPELLGIDAFWGTAGLTIAGGIAGWVEFFFLRRSLHRQIGTLQTPYAFILKAWLAAGLAGSVGYGIKILVGENHFVLNLFFVLIPYGFSYFALGAALGLEEPKRFMRKISKRLS